MNIIIDFCVFNAKFVKNIRIIMCAFFNILKINVWFIYIEFCIWYNFVKNNYILKYMFYFFSFFVQFQINSINQFFYVFKLKKN